MPSTFALRSRCIRGESGNPPRHRALQHDLLKDVNQDIGSDAAQLGVKDEVAPPLPRTRRDSDRHQRGDEIGVVMELVSLLEARRPREHPKDLEDLAARCPFSKATLVDCSESTTQTGRAAQLHHQRARYRLTPDMREILTPMPIELTHNPGTRSRDRLSANDTCQACVALFIRLSH